MRVSRSAVPLVALLFCLGSSEGLSAECRSDAECFQKPYARTVEGIRKWVMRPARPDEQKPAFDSETQLLRGGYFKGGWKPESIVLINTNLLLARTLDKLNREAGVRTRAEESLRFYLGKRFQSLDDSDDVRTYAGNDRREILYGTKVDCVRDVDDGQQYFFQNERRHFATALPSDECAPEPSRDGGPMNTFSLWTILHFMRGDTAKAKELFHASVESWRMRRLSDGSRVGHFTEPYDMNECFSSRVLSYWLIMARATGFWKLTARTQATAQAVAEQLAALQLPGGGIKVAYGEGRCGASERSSGESSGLALVALSWPLAATFSSFR